MAVNYDSEIVSLRDQVSEEEWQARVDLAALYRLIARHGWDDSVFTHITLRVPGAEEHFLMNPFGMLFDEINASSLVKVDIDGNILSETPYPINRAGFLIHSPIHRTRHDARCVIHLHTDAGIAVAAQKQGLLPISQQAVTLYRDVAYHDYEGLVFDESECGRLLADLGDKHFMMLRNHGTLAVGETAAEAYQRIYFLERSCAIQILASSGGAELILCSDDLIDKVTEQVTSAARSRQTNNPAQSGPPGGLVWAALTRLLDREDPSFRD